MNSLRNNTLLHRSKKICYLLIATLLFVGNSYAQQKQLDSGRKYTLNSVKVTGNQSFNEQTVIAFTGLKEGERLYVPGEGLSTVTKKLWDQNLFREIAFVVTNIDLEFSGLGSKTQEGVFECRTCFFGTNLSIFPVWARKTGVWSRKRFLCFDCSL